VFLLPTAYAVIVVYEAKSHQRRLGEENAVGSREEQLVGEYVDTVHGSVDLQRPEAM